MIVLLFALPALSLGANIPTTASQTINDVGFIADADLCTVTTFAGVEAAKKSCKNIVIDSMQVPGGKILDLLKLQKGTTVTFKGTTV